MYAYIRTDRESPVKGTVILLIQIPPPFPGTSRHCSLKAQHRYPLFTPRYHSPSCYWTLLFLPYEILICQPN